ncbi:GFA family protein [Algihabitans albus]|uniref:GFA family protein n=1 Tax=Algihabitans albus TaxID=2164067 RepID=UPI000E5D3C9E|nr:GFA family protein [Algihabitans albus]
MQRKTGRCLCGAVRFAYSGSEIWCGHCHCESCRRATSSLMTTFVGLPRSAVTFSGAAPRVYLSSPGVRRLFCGTCGSPLAYQSDRWPDEIHLYAASLSGPEEVTPQFHAHFQEHLPWLELADPLPHNAGSGD